ncbi:hypothetical protein PoB_002375700 [Plakobranchus ocellatus]|uniref:SMB domain-containing protein n=1 Tax=Plakobranchus ocellatus TaxID=259542 RepID=A0AAV3ZRU6_9GAST|nr:hypothetical protein PoB_002375700 [Plakobranchus ocellatus]
MTVLACAFSNLPGVSPRVLNVSITSYNHNSSDPVATVSEILSKLKNAEHEMPIQLFNASLEGPISANISGASETSPISNNFSSFATNKSSFSMPQRKDQMTSETGFFVHVEGLDLIGGDSEELLEETLALMPSDDTISWPNGELSTVGFGPVSTVNSDGIDFTLTFSCQGRCGMKISFPCSCSATCFAYGTCCDNMAKDCPHVWEEGLSKFDHIRRTDITCSKYSIYMISSCPRREIKLEGNDKLLLEKEVMSLETNNGVLHGVSTTSEIVDLSRINSTSLYVLDEDIRDRIMRKRYEAFLNAPVTDSETGFTFENRSVYDCNNMSESTALTWSLKLHYNFTNPTKIDDFDLFKTSNGYGPEFDKQILKTHLCRQNVIEECSPSDDFEELGMIYADKCQKSFALVRGISGSPTDYRNIFCAYCNEKIHREYLLILSNKVEIKQMGLELLMSLFESTTISLRLSITPEMSEADPPWLYAQCSNPDQDISFSPTAESKNSKIESKSVCSVTCKGPIFTARSDGICKAQHNALLAIADDGLPSLSSSAMTSLGEFLLCSLKSEVESLKHADLSLQSVSVMFDANTKKSLYVVELDLALPVLSSLFFSNDRKATLQNIYHFALIVRVFQEYRFSQLGYPRHGMNKQRPNSNLRVIQTKLLKNLVTMMGFSLTQGMEELRGPVMDKQNMTTVCLSNVQGSHNIEANVIFCMDDPVYERDANLVRRLRFSRCFPHLKNIEVLSRNKVTNNARERKGILFKCVLSFYVLVTNTMRTT